MSHPPESHSPASPLRALEAPGLDPADTVVSLQTPLATEALRGASSLEGAVVDHFRIERELGSGAMGTVYLAEDLSLERPVALKVLPARYADNAELTQRFLREARAQAKLHSAHVAHIYFIGELPPDDAGRRSLYFAMELVDGGALDEGLEAGEHLSVERGRQLMIQVALGLQDARAAGVIHRDIKPSNLLLDRRGRIRIADFGLAKATREENVRLTQVGEIVGSPLYMSPEQATGEADIDHRTDMYGLGATFFHLIAGEPPYDGPNPLVIVNQHCNAEVPRLDVVDPDVPRAVADIVARMMAKSPQDRFGTWREVLDALEAAAPERARYAGFWTRGAALGIDLLLAVGLVAAIGWFGAVLHLAYVTVAHARLGQTLGKRLFHLHVRSAETGERLNYGRSAIRTVANLWLPFLVGTFIALTQGTGEVVSAIEELDPTKLDALRSWLVAAAISNGFLSLLYGAGLAMCFVGKRRQALHDLVVQSEVVVD